MSETVEGIDVRSAFGPALTCEEWEAMEKGGRNAALGGVQNRHALAAIYLHGQPFGFTWEDVKRLRELDNHPGVFGARREHFRLLADRIAALLPPRE